MQRLHVCALASLVLVATCLNARAEGLTHHPSDSLAVRIDSIAVITTVPHVDASNVETGSSQTGSVFYVWRTADNSIDYTLDHATIRIDSLPDSTHHVDVVRLFDSLACAAVEAGAGRGHTIAGTPSSPALVHVHTVAYVQQSLPGSGAPWIACTTGGFATRTITCTRWQPNGGTTELVTASTGPAASPSGDCDKTYRTPDGTDGLLE